MSDRSDAVRATSTGLGEALAAAVRHPGITRVLVALGGSASTDGGAEPWPRWARTPATLAVACAA